MPGSSQNLKMLVLLNLAGLFLLINILLSLITSLSKGTTAARVSMTKEDTTLTRNVVRATTIEQQDVLTLGELHRGIQRSKPSLGVELYLFQALLPKGNYKILY